MQEPPQYALRTVVSDTLSVGVSTLAFTADTDDRSYLLTNNAGQPEAYITTSNFWHRLEVISQAEMEYLWIVSPTQSNANPSYVSFSRAAGGMTATPLRIPPRPRPTRRPKLLPQDSHPRLTPGPQGGQQGGG